MALLSIIVTNYNYGNKLRPLLDNIAEQTIKDFEVVIVDDCSEIPCDDIVGYAVDKGIALKLVKNRTRLYTKESRLVGVEASGGELITFIDADDIFYKTQALEYHVKMSMDTGADIVHFSAIHYENGSVSKGQFPWVQPIADRLQDGNIFERYTACNCDGHTVWGKIIRRGLWEKCLEPARKSSVRRFGEDFFLSSLLYFHAASYVGSSRIGYAREWVDKVAEKAFGRSTTMYAMLTEFIPYLIEHKASEEAVSRMAGLLIYHFKTYVKMFIDGLRGDPGDFLPAEVFLQISEHAEPERALRIILNGLSRA